MSDTCGQHLISSVAHLILGCSCRLSTVMRLLLKTVLGFSRKKRSKLKLHALIIYLFRFFFFFLEILEATFDKELERIQV